MIDLAESVALGAHAPGVNPGHLGIEPDGVWMRDRQGAIAAIKRKLCEGAPHERADLALMATLCCLRVGDLPREFTGWVLCDENGRFITMEITNAGSFDRVSSSLTEDLRHMLFTGAQRVVHFHSHPNGSAHPSDADLVGALQRAEALRLLGITLIDAWIVIGARSYVSLAQRRIVPFGSELAEPAVARYLAWQDSVVRSQHGLLAVPRELRHGKRRHRDRMHSATTGEDPIKRVRRRALALVSAIDMLQETTAAALEGGADQPSPT